MQYFETLIQTAVKQTILNLELNSLNKSTPSFAMPTKSIVLNFKFNILGFLYI